MNNIKIKPVIKWSGSKRSQVNQILQMFPEKYGTYYEPFLGGGSVMYCVNNNHKICGDICSPLIEFWKTIRDNPQSLIETYQRDWNRLQNEGYKVYYEIRDRFNSKQNAYDLLFLSRTCVNGLIRFNSNGEFNNSLHHTRKGINPLKLAPIIEEWSKKIQGVNFICGDYRKITENVKEGDLIYLDPPYFNTKGRYYGTIDFEDFFIYLQGLNAKKVKYILSFDGIRGEENFTVNLPKELYKRHIYIESGNSSFKKVMDKKPVKVKESLYLNW